MVFHDSVLFGVTLSGIFICLAASLLVIVFRSRESSSIRLFFSESMLGFILMSLGYLGLLLINADPGEPVRVMQFLVGSGLWIVGWVLHRCGSLSFAVYYPRRLGILRHWTPLRIGLWIHTPFILLGLLAMGGMWAFRGDVGTPIRFLVFLIIMLVIVVDFASLIVFIAIMWTHRRRSDDPSTFAMIRSVFERAGSRASW